MVEMVLEYSQTRYSKSVHRQKAKSVHRQKDKQAGFLIEIKLPLDLLGVSNGHGKPKILVLSYRCQLG